MKENCSRVTIFFKTLVTSSYEYDVINHVWNNFNKRMYSVSDEVAQSDMEFFDELIQNDEEFDSIIIMFKAIIGLTNEDYYNDGKEAIEDALSLDDSLNYTSKPTHAWYDEACKWNQRR